jgi:hypothetical protein
VLIFFSGQRTCFAQLDPWERVKLIEPGKRVSVALHSGKSIKGKMQEWSSEGLTVLQGKGRMERVLKSDVAKIELVAGMSRGRRAAWAGLIGGIAGGLLVVGSCASTGECDSSSMPAGVTAGIFSFGGVAAGIAALIPQHKEVIYTANRAVSGGGSSIGRLNSREVQSLQNRPENRSKQARDHALTTSER